MAETLTIPPILIKSSKSIARLRNWDLTESKQFLQLSEAAGGGASFSSIDSRQMPIAAIIDHIGIHRRVDAGNQASGNRPIWLSNSDDTTRGKETLWITRQSIWGRAIQLAEGDQAHDARVMEFVAAPKLSSSLQRHHPPADCWAIWTWGGLRLAFSLKAYLLPYCKKPRMEGEGREGKRKKNEGKDKRI